VSYRSLETPQGPRSSHIIAPVEATTAQLVTASVGVGGTLAAALLTQLLGRRAERERRTAEDRSRWLADRLRLNAHLLAGSLALERDLWSACAHLDREERGRRLPNHTSILLTPEGGVPGVLDGIDRSILVDAIEDSFERLYDLENLVAEISLVGTTSEANAARALHEALWNVTGLMEGYEQFDIVADAVEACRTARDDFTRVARQGLRVDGAPVAPDARPRAKRPLGRST
jgi:hypothetical protein